MTGVQTCALPIYNIDEFIYYSQHCNLWECNEQNMWIPTNKKMMIYNRQKNNQEQDAHNYMNILNKNLEQIYSTEDRRITLEDLEMNQLRSRFEEELELLGEFTRVIGRELNVEPNREYIFTDRILGYLRELRTRYSGLSIREIIDKEINSSLILEQSSSFIPGRNGQEPYPLIIHQIHFQGLIEHSVNMINRGRRRAQIIPRRTGDERREYYFRRSRLFNEQEQELGTIMAFFELHLDRLDLLNRLTRRTGHRIRNIRFDGNTPWADLWIRLRNRRNVGDVEIWIYNSHSDVLENGMAYAEKVINKRPTNRDPTNPTEIRYHAYVISGNSLILCEDKIEDCIQLLSKIN